MCWLTTAKQVHSPHLQGENRQLRYQITSRRPPPVSPAVSPRLPSGSFCIPQTGAPVSARARRLYLSTSVCVCSARRGCHPCDVSSTHVSTKHAGSPPPPPPLFFCSQRARMAVHALPHLDVCTVKPPLHRRSTGRGCCRGRHRRV